ncbi:MAG: signal peptidase I [Armatimonadetes bacterium]|nr:signal peptidase I [Armatimonadota bacterium]
MMAQVQTNRARKVVFTGFGVFLLFVLGFVVFFYWNFNTIEVKGDSMEPTFHSGQRLLISKAYWLVGGIKKNDIVVVKNIDGGDTIIKRVYALPGQIVDYYNVPETYDISKGEYKVPSGQLYILGDNRPVSDDSRLFGPVKYDNVLGKVVVVRFGFPVAAIQ